MTYAIPPELYDGQMHRVPFQVGRDFVAKWRALSADGFTMKLTPDAILACKMAGDPLPPMVEART